MDCPSYERIAQALLGQEVAREDREHIGSCPVCSQRMDLLTRMEAGFRAGPLAEVPDHLRRKVEGLGRAAAKEPRPSILSALKVLIAELVPPPPPSLRLAMRSAGSAPSRRLYRTEAAEIDLLLTPDGTLMGQLMLTAPDPLEDAQCTLLAEDCVQVPLSPTGEFRFDGVPDAPLDLTFEWPGTRILLPEVDFST